MKKGAMMLLRVIGFMVIVAFVSIITFWPLAQRVGDAPVQKTLYVGNDLSMLLRIVSALPENANIVYDEFVDGTVSIKSGTLFVTTTYEQPAKIRGPSYIEFSAPETPASYSYVQKNSNYVTIASSSLTTCVREAGNIKNTDMSFIFNPVDNEAQKVAYWVETYLRQRYNVDKGDDLVIEFITDESGSIGFNTIGSRASISLACFIQKSTSYERNNLQDENNLKKVVIFVPTGDATDKVGTAIVLGIEQYFGVNQDD